MASQPKDITQTNKVELGPEQKEVFGLAMPSIKEYAGQDTQLFPGSAIEGFNPTEVAGQQAALSAIPGLQGLASSAQGAQSKLLDPGFMLNPNEYLAPAADAVRHQGTQALEDTLRTLRGGSEATGGQYSSGRTRQGTAEGVATGRTNQGISDAVAKMYLDNYQKGLGLMSEATKNNQSIMTQGLFPSQVMSAVGGQQRAMDQAKLNEEVQKFYTGQDLPLLKSQQLLALINGMPGAEGKTTVQGAGTQAQPWQQALGLGLSLAGAGMGMPGMGVGMGMPK
jgi:hypothetical protein